MQGLGKEMTGKRVKVLFSSRVALHESSYIIDLFPVVLLFLALSPICVFSLLFTITVIR
jgi:hypothetical protein